MGLSGCFTSRRFTSTNPFFSMFLRANNIPEIYRLLAERPDELDNLSGAEVSLTVTLFLAIAHRHAEKRGAKDLARKIGELNLPGVAAAREKLEPTHAQRSPDSFGSPSFDLYRITSKDDLLSPQWPLFYDRFRRSAASGRKGRTYRAVGGVLGEMGDNVVSHAFEHEDKPCLALAGFHVADGTACFCVADLGQGFLQSLRRASAWTSLQTDQQALDAVVTKNATSRQGETQGGGFKQLFSSLLDFNGLVLLRSGSCGFQLENDREVRRLTALNSLHVPGSVVTVAISDRAKPCELPVKKIQNSC
jgi:hypothetical protein